MVPMDINSQVEELIKMAVEAEEAKKKKLNKKRQWLKAAESNISTVIQDKLNNRSGDC